MSGINQSSYCNVVGNTDIGCKRKANEDWLDYFECSNGLVAVVCDGMGGHVGGQVASRTAVDAIRAFLQSRHYDDPNAAIVAACNAANEAILQKASEQPELTGMGSTCVMLIVRDGKVYIGSIGDSRIYLVRGHTIRQLTKDQSYVQTLVDAGKITKEEAERHPRKNEITNALGLERMQPATVFASPIEPQAGDSFVLCSDGLSGMVGDEEIMRVVSNRAGMSQQKRVQELIERAKSHGGLDNITCQIVEFSITPPQNSTDSAGSKKKRTATYAAIAIAAVVLIAAVGFFFYKHFGNEPKASGYVKEMRTQDSTVVITGPGIKYKDREIVFVMEYSPTFNSTAIKVLSEGKPVDTIAAESLKPQAIKVEPAEGISTTESADSRTVRFATNFDNEDVSVTFKKGDSTFVYYYPIMREEANADNGEDSGGMAPMDDTHKKIKGEVVLFDYSAITQKDFEATITVDGSKDSYAVSLIKGKGTNTNSQIYSKFAPQETMENHGWYLINSSKDSCGITIVAKDIPRGDAEIEIRLASLPDSIREAFGDKFTIRVKKK